MEGRSCGGGISAGSSIKILVSAEDEDIPQMWCPQCRRHLPVEKFNKNKARYSGFGSECKECANANRKRYPQYK